MAQTALSGSVFSHLHHYVGDSPVIKFMLQFVLLSFAGFITTQYATLWPTLTAAYKRLFAKSGNAHGPSFFSSFAFIPL
jgi:hypothetical protein